GPVFVAGDRAYVPTNDGTLTIIDFADPAAPAVRGSLAGYYSLRPLAAVGSLVFTFGSDLVTAEGVKIVDARDASSPVTVGSYVPCIGSGFNALAVSSDGATLGIACYDASVEIVDTRDPSTPALISTYRPADPSDATTAMVGYGTTFYLGNAHGIDEV